ncbi:hypothetical protein JF539_24555 [Labrenzia aggregata]|uniref:Uncharacterized protein n=1 Tax=Roseibium aggregatum TaxID=187304 RepID=A0A939EI36_9HYPH|nr:hypothetical protein [Roseibium aggregatum]
MLFAVKLGRALLLLYLLFLAFVTRDWDRAFPLMLIAMIYLPMETIVQTLLQAAVSKIGYDTLTSGRSSGPAVAHALMRNLFALLFIGFVSAIVRHVSESKQNGILGFFLAILVFAVTEVWDLVSNFGISGIVVDNASVRTLVQRLKELRAHVPETLAGVIGIDLAGSLVSALFAGGILLGLFGGGAAGYVYADHLPQAFLAQFGSLEVNTLPSLLLLSISFSLDALVKSATVCAKSLYFTMLYVLIVRPQELEASQAAAIESVATATLGAKAGAA